MGNAETPLVAKSRAVREQQRRLDTARVMFQMSLSLEPGRRADRGATLARIRQWRSWFADQIAALPPEEHARERQVLALVDTVVGDAAAAGR